MRGGVDGLFEFPRVPQLDRVVAASGHHQPAVGAYVDAAGPGVWCVCVVDLAAWSVVGTVSSPHQYGAVQGGCHEEIVSAVDLTAPCDGSHSTSSSRTGQSRLVDNDFFLLHSHIDVPDP